MGIGDCESAGGLQLFQYCLQSLALATLFVMSLLEKKSNAVGIVELSEF